MDPDQLLSQEDMNLCVAPTAVLWRLPVCGATAWGARAACGARWWMWVAAVAPAVLLSGREPHAVLGCAWTHCRLLGEDSHSDILADTADQDGAGCT